MDGSLGGHLDQLAPSTSFDLVTIESWLTAYVAMLIEQHGSEIDVTLPFSAYALSSVDVAGLTAALEDWLGVTLDPTLLWDHPSIRALARHLASLGTQS